LCEGADFRPLFDKGFRVEVCRGCGLVCVAETQRNLAAYYALEYRRRVIKSPGDQFVEKRTRNRAIVRWVQRTVPDLRAAHLLEIGCSAGYLLKEFARAGVSVSGIEPCLHASGIAKSVNRIANVQCCMLEDAEEHRQYDVVVLIQTFEHLAQPLSALRKIRRLLKPEGLLFIEVPNFLSAQGFYRRWIRGVPHPSANHLFVYTKRTLAGMLQKAGFEMHALEGYRNIRAVAQPRLSEGVPECGSAPDYERVIAAWSIMRVFYAVCGVFGRIVYLAVRRR
jgi:2-polyprenyl-3-methyl-5-hydroxy-6-metoxy-1,4-benzoquinol methylase